MSYQSSDSWRPSIQFAKSGCHTNPVVIVSPVSAPSAGFDVASTVSELFCSLLRNGSITEPPPVPVRKISAKFGSRMSCDLVARQRSVVMRSASNPIFQLSWRPESL